MNWADILKQSAEDLFNQINAFRMNQAQYGGPTMVILSTKPTGPRQGGLKNIFIINYSQEKLFYDLFNMFSKVTKTKMDKTEQYFSISGAEQQG
jgi:hypothetical protein